MFNFFSTAWDWLWVKPEGAVGNMWLIIPFLLGVGLAFNPQVWKYTSKISTWFHEMGHALIAIIFGRVVTGVKINKDSSGVTEHYGKPGIGSFFITFAGYPAPAVTGSVLLFLTLEGFFHLAIATLVLVVVVALILRGNFRTFMWTTMLALFTVSLIYLPSIFTQLLITTFAGFLCAASPKNIYELRQYHKQRKKMKKGNLPTPEKNPDTVGHSDAETLASMTFIPTAVWEVVFLTVAVAAPVLAIYQSY